MDSSSAAAAAVNDLVIETFGWPEMARSEQRIDWSDGVGSLVLALVPAIPGLAAAVGSRPDLESWVAIASRAINRVAMEADWQRSASGVELATFVARPVELQRSVSYWGRLLVPAIDYTWIVELQRPEVSSTGIREAIWVDRQLVAGVRVDDITGIIQNSFAGGGPHPADDKTWDEAVPDHPLSRIRRELPVLADSVRFHSPERVRPQPDPPVPPGQMMAATLVRHRAVLGSVQLACVELENPSTRTDPATACELIGGQMLETTSGQRTTRLYANPPLASIRPIAQADVAAMARVVIGQEHAARGVAAGPVVDELADAFAAELDDAQWYANFSPTGGVASAMKVSTVATLLVCGIVHDRLIVLMHEQ